MKASKCPDCNCPLLSDYQGVHVNENQKKNKRKKNLASRRLEFLAQPKTRMEKFYAKSLERRKFKVEIIRPDKISTRLKQLAISPVRQLLIARDQYKSVLFRTKYDNLNKKIWKSLNTVYTRLGNTHLPAVKMAKPKWSAKDWEIHRTRLDKIAQPKKQYPMKLPKRKSKPLQELMKRIDAILLKKIIPVSQSKPRLLQGGAVSKAAMNYKASSRIFRLSKPISRKNLAVMNGATVLKTALAYKATERIQNLAQPKKKKIATYDVKENAFAVSERALKAKASPRTIKLAKPKKLQRKK